MIERRKGLHRLVYRSRATPTGQPTGDELREIVEGSQRRNGQRDVTGALLVAGGVFIQALEGDRGELERLFESICCDLRHCDVELVEFNRVESRSFGEWGMQLVHPQASLQTLFRQLEVTDTAPDSELTAEAVRMMAAVVASNVSAARVSHVA